MAIPERYFLIGWTVLFLGLIAMELASAVRRSVVLNGEAIVIRSGLRPVCTLPIAEMTSVTLTRDTQGKKPPLHRRYGYAHRSGADSLILTCRDGRRYRLAVEYHLKFQDAVASRLAGVK